MPTYAVKIGEIHLKSDKPITQEDVDHFLIAVRTDTITAIAEGLADETVKLVLSRR